ncbi:MAG: hypothetical protein IPF44_00060 [Betaproteobacteria bacterium]|nr:hypothetical protein [Betaproteobacteria bacterium]MBP6203578.1 hypothetical protein [Azonexus sp.]
MTSDQIAAFALLVSIGAFWLSYKSWYLSRKLITAEKRTLIWNSLVETRLALQDLHFSIREISRAWENAGPNSGVAHSEETEKILSQHKALDTLIQTYESQISTLSTVVNTGLERFKTNSTNDPVVLEESRAMADEIRARTNNLISNTDSLKVEIGKYSQRFASK